MIKGMGVQRQDTNLEGGQSAAPKRKRADTSNSSTGSSTANNKRQCLTNSLCLASDDMKVLGIIEARYDVQLQSVISSSKMKQRVSAMLRHLTPPTTTEPAAPDATTAKAKVSVLRAKAADAGKLISIAEIAKREIEREGGAPRDEDDAAGSKAEQESKAGRWFQYIALGEETRQRSRDEGNTIIEETVLGGSGTNEQDDKEDEFEVMKTPFERAIEGRPMVRGVPVMSLFLSRSPIEELKRRYGEQTNFISA
ncbi:hypothetical protein F5Y08DRAFT_233394 [Xylaria arbuscula]|uniref:Uncharacterized protein n=1 Tax=Xylaria arbuscula TaxID=114810 RepID=A0A9W8NJ77_9PEZI|nr:hypothetical protein F5Y08DRAFT_233394 [Xylaria arbuscula]KAJ3578146.1 hypothetical protein NPX13_g2421 [Xylaria arbuscula]